MAFLSKKMTHADGGMHHLGIREEDTAKNVILIPDPLLVPLIASFMDGAEKRGDYREYITYTGSYKNKPITVMSSGFGCMPMAIAVEELNHLGVKRIVKIASCPAIQPELRPGDIFLASGAVRGEGATLEYIDYQYPAVSDMDLLPKLAKATGGEVGIIRSHDATYRESPYAPDGNEIIRHWADLGVSVLDGETSALFVITTILGVKSASVSIIEENYLDGSALNKSEVEQGLKKIFGAAADVLVSCDE